MSDGDGDVYPDVPADAEGADALVRVLSEWDASHHTKAIALVGCARREWAETDREEDFMEFVQVAIEEMDETMEADS